MATMSQASVCDGDLDCEDGSDEDGCPPLPPCPNGTFTCANRRCIPPWYVCDTDNDCGDWSDEVNCTVTTVEPCPDDLFTCTNGECALQAWTCDGDMDCSDGSDEEGCPPRPTCEPGQFTCNNTRCIPSAWICDGDNDCGDLSDESTCGEQTCGPSMFQCANTGRCIPAIWICDGDNDCGDMSDEQNCVTATTPRPSSCGPDQFQCHNTGRCIPAGYICDGDNDCGDMSDEQNCGVSPTPSGCGPGQFQCPSSGLCIPEGYLCDGDNDCGDNSDEVNCGHESGCPANFMYLSTGSLCYHVAQISLQWQSASQYCRALDSRAHLLVINDEAEQQVVAEGLSGNPTNRCAFWWTAGRRLDDSTEESPFIWNTATSQSCPGYDDLSVMSYSPWMARSHTPNVPTGQPACVTLNGRQGAAWDDKSCDAHACILCEIDV